MSIYLSNLVLKVCEPRLYHGKEAHRKLNELAEHIHRSIIDACRRVSKAKLLKRLYEEFEKSCYNVLSREYWLFQPVDVILAVERQPSIFRYLIEASLYADSRSEGKVSDDLIVALVKAANLFLEICNFSDYLYYGGFSGGFTVTEKGDIQFVAGEGAKKVAKNYLDMVVNRERNIVARVLREQANEKRLEKRPLFNGVVKPYERAFKERYGVSLCTLAKIVEHIFFNYPIFPPQPTLTSYSSLVAKLREAIAADKRAIKRAISFFELSREMLLEGWKYYKFYDVRPNASRCPVIRLSGGVGKKGLILFGPNALMRAFVILVNDLDRGVIELGPLTRKMSEERGREFEKRVREEVLPAYGFDVLRITDAPVGEIDAVALSKSTGVMLVVEAKSPKIDASAKSITRQLERTERWCKIHQKKVNWVKGNLGNVINRFGLHEFKVTKVIGVIVLEVPVYTDPEVEEKTSIKVMTVQQFKLFLNSIKRLAW